MTYTFEMANKFACSHNIKYIIEPYHHWLLDDICYEVTVCDAFDRYLSSESYFIQCAYPNGFCYRRRYFRYSMKKDEMLLSRICAALEDDIDNVVCGEWL